MNNHDQDVNSQPNQQPATPEPEFQPSPPAYRDSLDAGRPAYRDSLDAGRPAYRDSLDAGRPADRGPLRSPQSNKNLWLYLLVGLVVAGGAFGFYVWQKGGLLPALPTPTPTITPTSTTTPDPTANWQTYRNDEFGFEFRYPKSFASTSTQGSFGECFEEPIGIKFCVRQEGNFDLQVIQQKFAPTGVEELPEQILIGDYHFYKYDRGGGGGVKYPDLYFRPSDGKILIFEFTDLSEDKTPSDNTKKLAVQILSTFTLVWPTVSSGEQKELEEADVKKIADVTQFRTAAEFYYEKYGRYPAVEGNTPEERWQSFGDLIISEGLLTTVPQDPRRQVRGFSYDYQTDTVGQRAVFKAILEIPSLTGRFLKDSRGDSDGIIYGIDCNDPNYCLFISK